jgi:hypothetical protein
MMTTTQTAMLVARAAEQIEKVYERFIAEQVIQHTRLAKIGFLGVMHEIINDDEDLAEDVKKEILKYIGVQLDTASDGLKGRIQEHMLAVGKGE